MTRQSQIGRKLCPDYPPRLKVSPKKVRIFPASTETYGIKLQNGSLSPLDHFVTSLGITSIAQLKSVKHVNAWRGLYKTLLHYLPDLSSFIHPYDLATANKSSKDIQRYLHMDPRTYSILQCRPGTSSKFAISCSPCSPRAAGFSARWGPVLSGHRVGPFSNSQYRRHITAAPCETPTAYAVLESL
jgi:hypothetical protein